MKRKYRQIELKNEDIKYFKLLHKGHRVDDAIDLAIALAQVRGYSRGAFLATVRQIWGETEDVLKEREWMKQIRL
jgi:hypothetical protein